MLEFYDRKSESLLGVERRSRFSHVKLLRHHVTVDAGFNHQF